MLNSEKGTNPAWRSDASDGDFMARIAASDVEGRIGLGVSLRLGLPQRLGEGEPSRRHAGEYIVAGAVDDGLHRADVVSDHRLADRLDDRHAAPDSRLEVDRNVVALGRLEYLGAVQGQKGLVRRNDVLALREGREDEVPRDPGPADQLDGDSDVGIFQDIAQPSGTKGIARRQLREARRLRVHDARKE